MIANKLLIYGFSAFAGIYSVAGSISIFKDKLDLIEENKGLKMDLAVYRASHKDQVKRIDSLSKVKCYTPADTLTAFINGYSEAINQKACDYTYKGKKHTVFMGAGTCKVICKQEVATLNSDAKVETGEIEDASIHKR